MQPRQAVSGAAEDAPPVLAGMAAHDLVVQPVEEGPGVALGLDDLAAQHAHGAFSAQFQLQGVRLGPEVLLGGGGSTKKLAGHDCPEAEKTGALPARHVPRPCDGLQSPRRRYWQKGSAPITDLMPPVIIAWKSAAPGICGAAKTPASWPRVVAQTLPPS